MQLKNFRIFIGDVIREGNRLQKHDINGKPLTSKRFTDTQTISMLISLASIFILNKGFSENFAGFTISFLGIFVGLFSSIVITMYDKRHSIIGDYNSKTIDQQTQTIRIKNYLVQFTGLTAYSILIAIVLIILLSFVLLHDVTKVNLYNYTFVNLKEIDWKSIGYFIKNAIVITYRYYTTYLLLNFFFITLFSTTSFFSFLSSEYKEIKLKK